MPWPVRGKIFLLFITIFSLKFIYILYKNSALLIHVHCEIHSKNAELFNVASKCTTTRSYHWASSGKFSHILNYVQMYLKVDGKNFRKVQEIPIKYLFLELLALCVREGSILQISAIISPSFLICLLWFI
jgi:tRNA(Phe) wybutosine-synthesizing methylase Tyw3